MSRYTEPAWMYHAELDRTIKAVRSQVPELGAAGWVEVDPPAPEPKPVKESKPGHARPASEKERGR
jgi:hypothetical protein